MTAATQAPPAKSERDEEGNFELFTPAPDEKLGTTRQVLALDVNAIEPDPEQPRSDADPGLYESIRDHGVLQPITVRPQTDPEKLKKGVSFIIKYGERRWRGSVKAGRPTIPAYVDRDSKETEVQRLIRQVQADAHRSLNPIDEARTFARIRDLTNLSGKKLAELVRKPKSTVADRLALWDAPEPFKPLFISGALTESAAPIVQKYSEVPVEIVERAVKDASTNYYQWKEAIAAGKPVPLETVKRTLDQIILHQLLGEVPEELALEYQGPTVAISGKHYATDRKELDRVAAAFVKRREKEEQEALALSNRPRNRDVDRHQEHERARAKKHRRDQQLRRLQFTTISAKLPITLDAPGWARFLVDGLIEEVHADTLRVLCGLLKLTTETSRNGGMSKYSEAMKKHAAKLDAGGLLQLALQMLLAVDVSISPWATSGAKRIAAAAALTRVDLKKLTLPDEPEPKATTAAKKSKKGKNVRAKKKKAKKGKR